jgi:hypothetical protein
MHIKILFIALLLSATSTFIACGHHEQQPTTTTTSDPNAKYACPMHPDITGKAGDKCSKCGMKLTQVAQKPDSGNTEHK